MSHAIDQLSLAAADGVDAQLAAPLNFSVPVTDNDEFSLLKPKRRHEINVTLRLLERVHALRAEKNFVEAVKTLAAGYRHIRGLSAESLRRKYSSYRDAGGNWRALIKGYVAPSAQPPEFQEFIKGLVEQNQRSVATALNKLREEIWPSGAHVPGYGTWPEFFAKKYPTQTVPRIFPRIWPTGWSVRNLRHYGPTKAERAMFGQGIAAAHAHLPTLRRDPSKLRPMELITIDDFQLDVRCYFRGDAERGLKPQLAYAGGLLAMCVGTRKKLAWLLGPMIDREEKQPDGTTKIVRCSITAQSVQGLLYEIFRDHGLPEYPVTILCENAAAAIKPELELMLSTIYGGRIRVQRTSLIHHKTLTNGFTERGGTPWQKGWIESEFNYLWNQLADLKGYKGSNERLNAPADLADKIKYAAKLLGQGDNKLNLPSEIIDQLHVPFHSVEELQEAFSFVIARSELRTRHQFLGFDTVTEFRWPNPALPAPQGIDVSGPNNFRSLALLTPEQQLAMVPDERKECIRERWERLCAQHPRTSLNPAALALFLLTPKKATFRKHCVSFTHNKEGFSYIDDAAVLPALEEGTELLAYVDFNTPASAYITRIDGTPLGVLRMLGNSTRGVDITDPVAMAEARVRRTALVNRVLAGVQNRPLHQAANAALLAGREHNDAIIAAYQRETASMPVADKIGAAMGERAAASTAQRDQDASLRRAKNRTDALLDESPAPTAPVVAQPPADSVKNFSSEDLL